MCFTWQGVLMTHVKKRRLLFEVVARIEPVILEEELPKRRLGFMLDDSSLSDAILDNIDSMNSLVIQDMFEGKIDNL